VRLGSISTYAGSGECQNSGDGGPALSASLTNTLRGLAIDSQGNLHVASGDTIRRIDHTTGIISSVASGAGLPSAAAPESD